MKILLRILLTIVVLIVVIFIGITVSFNRSQPSIDETKQAIMLADSLHKYVSSKNQYIFAGASKNKVAVEVYGILDINIQEKILYDIKNNSKNLKFNGKVYVYFFPERDYIKKEINGLTVFELKQSELLRKIEIIQS